MKQILIEFFGFIEKLVMVFYPLFRRFMPEQTFKYAATGGANTTLDILLYYIAYHFVLHGQILELGFFAISPHIAAFMMSFSITFPIGFLLAYFISFPGSYLRKRIQILRYGLTVVGSILLNYLFLKLFVEVFQWLPIVAKIATTLIVIVFSYIAQKYFTFKQQLYN